MKKALAGPAKRTATAKKKPERGAMIAAARRRTLVVRVRARTLTDRVDRRVNKLMVRAWPRITGSVRRLRVTAARWGGRAWNRLRPFAVRFFRLLSLLERRLLRLRDLGLRTATRASAVLTPERAICLAILAAAACLAASQFVEYRAVEVGQPGYAGLAGTSPPTVEGETPAQAHSFLLLPVALLAAASSLAVMRNGRRRGLGRVVLALGALSLAVVLLVDLPAGLDESGPATRFAGATAVLYDGFYAEIAAAAGLMLGGALLVLAPTAAARYHARPCRTRTNLFARAASGLRRRRPRRASSRGRGARKGSRRRKGAVSAPASPR
jgi:hypothetical protein